jgi:hypothetical protein
MFAVSLHRLVFVREPANLLIDSLESSTPGR